MDPSSSSTPPTPTVTAPPTAVPASAPPADAPAIPTSENHPPYDEMICTAIATLGKGKGSTKNAIGKFMEQTYQGLPSNHNNLLIEHLHVLTSGGRLVMVKKSYQLRNSDASPPTSQRKPGRAPKRKLDQPPPDVPLNANPPVTRRGPGRAPKVMMNVVDQAGPSAPSSKRRGRPPKKQTNITAVPFAPSPGFPVPAYAVPPSGASPQAVGAGSSGGVRTPQDPAGSSVGWPKKVTSVEEELRRKLEHFQSKVNQYIRVIKPHFTIDSPLTVIAAIQELERLATMDLDGPLTNETQELPPQQ